ncbi:MAG: hypothetical protein SGBAC_007363 [Bacillariaceae sp.]
MFKRLSSTKSTRKNTKAVTSHAPAKTEPVEEPIVEEKEPVSEIRADEGIEAPRDAIEAMDNVISKAEKTACANDTVRGAMEYAIANGREGDTIDQVFSHVEEMTCAPDNDMIAAPINIKKCAITKFSKEEKVGISLRTSLSTDGLYVNSISAGSKFESTELALGQKVLKINGKDCPATLAEAIGMLKSAESSLVLEVGPNDEAAKKFEEMGQMETTDLVVKKAEPTEIAVDGYANSCGFFWSLQNGLCALQDLDNKIIEADSIVEEVEEAPKEEEEAPKVEEEAKPVIETKALADEESPKQKKKKKKSLLKKPSLPSLNLNAHNLKQLGQSKKSKTTEQPVEEAPKEDEEAPKLEEQLVEESPKEVEEAPKAEETAPMVEEAAPKAEEEAPKEEAKPEPEVKALVDEDAPVKENKRKSFLKKPSLPSIKAPSMPSLKLGLGKKKSKKVVEEPPSPVETITGEDGMMTIKFTKDSIDESVGLALRNSVLNDSIYVYGIFEGSKLKASGLGENMRVHTINGEPFSNVEEAVKMIKEAPTLEFLAGPNDEPEAPEEEEEEEETEEEEEPKAAGGWFW